MPENPELDNKTTPDKMANDSLADTSLTAVEAESSDDMNVSPVPSPEQLPRSDAATDTLPTIPAAVRAAQQRKEPINKKRIGLIIGAVATVFICVGGGATAYAWYTDPEKVVTDSLAHAASASTMVTSASVQVKTNDTQFNITLDSNRASSGENATTKINMKLGKDMPEITLSEETTYMYGSATYIRMAHLTDEYNNAIGKLVQQAADEMSSQGYQVTPQMTKQIRASYDGMFLPIIKKIDNQWIKITSDDIRSIDKSTGDMYACSDDAYKKLTSDATLMPHVMQLYKKDKPLTITKGSETKGSSLSYDVKIDHEGAKTFAKDVLALPNVKTYTDCLKESDDSKTSSSASSSDSLVDAISKTHMTVWVNKWNHTLTGFDANFAATLSDNMTISATVSGQTSFGKKVTVEAPQNAKSISEISKDIGSILKTYSPDDSSSAGTFSRI